jgi:hypothetical protein
MKETGGGKPHLIVLLNPLHRSVRTYIQQELEERGERRGKKMKVWGARVEGEREEEEGCRSGEGGEGRRGR